MILIDNYNDDNNINDNNNDNNNKNIMIMIIGRLWRQAGGSVRKVLRESKAGLQSSRGLVSQGETLF